MQKTPACVVFMARGFTTATAYIEFRDLENLPISIRLTTILTFIYKKYANSQGQAWSGPYRVRGTWPRRNKEGAQNRLLMKIYLAEV